MPTYLTNVSTTWSEDHAIIVVADDERHATIRTENILRDQTWTEDGISCAVLRTVEIPTNYSEDGRGYACPLCDVVGNPAVWIVGTRELRLHFHVDHDYFSVTIGGEETQEEERDIPRAVDWLLRVRELQRAPFNLSAFDAIQRANAEDEERG